MNLLARTFLLSTSECRCSTIFRKTN